MHPLHLTLIAPELSQPGFRTGFCFRSRSRIVVSLGDAVGDYLTHLRAVGRSPATVDSYSRSLVVLSGILGSGVPLEALSADALETALVRIAGQSGKANLVRCETTLNRYRSTFKGFFRWAFETGRVSANPAARLRLARVDSPPTTPISSRETSLLLSAIRNSDDPRRLRDEALFSIYAFAGLRRAEALGLLHSDYDATAAILRINNAKGRQVRTVPVIPALGSLLDKYMVGAGSSTGDRSSKLFPGRRPEKSLTARQTQTRFDFWKGVVGLRDQLSIHSFRAGFATTLHEDSRDVVLVSRALGHRDLRPTLRYVELSHGALRLAMERAFTAIG